MIPYRTITDPSPRMNTPYKARIEHSWICGHSFDIWRVDAGTPWEAYVFSVDAATVRTGSLADCKAAWIREDARVLRAHKPRRR